ncbi:hypothetical protein F7725_029041, partial [Dissostichus mawsoni]
MAYLTLLTVSGCWLCCCLWCWPVVEASVDLKRGSEVEAGEGRRGAQRREASSQGVGHLDPSIEQLWRHKHSIRFDQRSRIEDTSSALAWNSISTVMKSVKMLCRHTEQGFVSYLSLPVVLHHGQVLGQVLQAALQLGILSAGEFKELSHQQVSLVSQPGCLPGVGGQQRADLPQDNRTDSYLEKRVVISALFLQLLCFVDSADSHLYQVTEDSPAMWRSCFLVAVLTGSVFPVSGFSNGKVSVACGDMMPQHGHGPSPEPPPFSITVDKASFTPGDNITEAFSTPTYFKGFLIEARDAGKLNSPAVGSFLLTDPQESQLLQCGHTQDRLKKDSHSGRVATSNKPPQRVQFLVTVLHKYKVFWVKMAGPVVSLHGATAAPSTPAPPPTSSPPLCLSRSAGCGLSKSCLRDPVGCHPESDPTCFFLSFVTDQQGGSVTFELSGPAEGYLTFALSLDKWMGNDDVYMCVSDGGSVTISAAYSLGEHTLSRRYRYTLRHTDHYRHTVTMMAVCFTVFCLQQDLWGRAWRLADGLIQCRFQRKIILPHAEGRFNLSQSYFLFLANGRSQQGFIHRHDRQPLISSNQKEITGPPDDLCGSRSPLLIKIHGVLMMTVWMWMVSTAIFIARHYKNVWPEKTLLGQKLWFQLHRTIMVLAVLLTAVAFTLPFIYRMGWSKHAGSHPYIGCTVMVLSLIQLIMGALRPAPDSPRRIIFNWMHLVTGTAGQALLLPSPSSPAVLAVWLLWILLAHLLLQIHSCTLRREGSDRESIWSAQSWRQQPEEKSNVKKMVFVVFLLGNTAFLAAFITTIA